ncbi:MAG: extracellular solute-binding protein [Clostridia bacterium]|nr:extracellular solute-binding protein [Clostridia bacterium]
MKNWARVLCVLCVLALVVVSFGACNNGGGNDNSTSTESGKTTDIAAIDGQGATIKLGTPRIVNLEPGVSDETDLLIKRIEEVNKKYNIKFEFNSEIDQSDYWDFMVAKAMGGEVFGDIMLIYPYFLDEWVAGNIVADVAPIAKEVGIDWNDGTWDPTVKDTGTFGSKIYSFSREQVAMTAGLVYNTRLLKAANLADPSTLVSSKEWNFSKLETYAKELTKKDTSGNVTQYGLITTTDELLLGCFMLANGAKPITYGDDNMPKLELDGAKCLEAMNVFNTMASTDKSLFGGKPFLADWQKAADTFVNGKAGMIVCEEWVVEYIRDKMVENGNAEDYALTYFPMGPNGTDYVDASFGGSTEYFIYNNQDANVQKLAFSVYCDLYAPDTTVSEEDRVTAKGEALFSDNNSVDVYKDIILNHKSESLGLYKLGLNVRQAFKDIYQELVENKGTPQSIANTYKAEIEAAMDESTYLIEIKKQNGAA